MSKKKPFKMAFGLVVSPDFSLVIAGKAQPPFVDHSSVNFKKLRECLTSAFKYGPHVEILTANDTIDQVTIHTRLGMLGTQEPDAESAECRDFGQAMVDCAANAVDGVIDVRKAWKNLHAVHIRNRDSAPPPSIISFMILAEDFEDAQIWHMSSRPVIGLKAFDPANPRALADQDGTLPKSLQSDINDIFGCPFEDGTALAQLGSDKVPSIYQNLRR